MTRSLEVGNERSPDRSINSGFVVYYDDLYHGIFGGLEMSSQYETWYHVKDGKLYEHWENDGYACMRHGVNPRDYYVCTVEEAKTKWPHWFKKEFENEA